MNGYHDVNLAMLLQVASRLGVLLDRVVFVGGCTTGLFLTDTAAAPVRPTLDVDLIVEVVSPKDYRDLEKTLRQLGFRQPDDKGSPICRWQIDTVDVMPTDESILGFTNRWYAPAIKTA